MPTAHPDSSVLKQLQLLTDALRVTIAPSTWSSPLPARLVLMVQERVSVLKVSAPHAMEGASAKHGV